MDQEARILFVGRVGRLALAGRGSDRRRRIACTQRYLLTCAQRPFPSSRDILVRAGAVARAPADPEPSRGSALPQLYLARAGPRRAGRRKARS
jgi:hypothetical protein